MAAEYKIISIGTMACNLIWGERGRVRTQHATTTLVEEGGRRFLVDPSLPPEVLDARLHERAGKRLDDMTDVFCTTLHPAARRGLEGLAGADWWCGREELEDFSNHIRELAENASGTEDPDNIKRELGVIRRFRPAPDTFTENIGIFPLPGYSRGCTGLLLTRPASTVLLAGPAVPTADHVHRGMVWEQCADSERAKESLLEILEIADVIVPGFDNLVLQPSKWMGRNHGI